MKVKVCDMIMGAGKTESAISLMNSDQDSHFIFITPYLDEVERIKASCAGRDFKDPQHKGEGKLEDLHELLTAKRNIASTHALFRRYNQETISLIRDGGYKLILDEVFEVTRVIEISQKDFKLLTDQRMIEADESGRVRWTMPEYEGKFDELRDMCMTGNVVMYNGCLLLWLFPVEVFHAFLDVIVLTYMFDAQVQRYYFDMNGIEVQHIGTTYERGEYHFCDYPCMPDYVLSLHEKIHVIDDAKLNAIGDGYGNLSSSWFLRAKKEKDRPMLKALQKNLINVFKNKWNAGTDQNLWTVFKDYQDQIKGKGYTKGFLSCNVRATNAYRNRDHLAYCVNIFYNPLLKNYFKDHGVEVHEEEYALSEMIQWIWRSAIRDGKEVWVYVPSRRMRDLLRQWLLDLSSPANNKDS